MGRYFRPNPKASNTKDNSLRQRSRPSLDRSFQRHLKTKTFKTVGNCNTPKPFEIRNLSLKKKTSCFFSHLSGKSISIVMYPCVFTKARFQAFGLRLVFKKACINLPWKANIAMSATFIWIIGFACLIFGIHTLLRILLPENNDIYW